MTTTLAENCRHFREKSENLNSNKDDEVKPVKKDNSCRRQNLQELISGPRHAPLPENYSNDSKELTFKSKAFLKRDGSNGGNQSFQWFIGLGIAVLTAGILYKLLK
jgi:hypothetical protein